MNFNGTLIIRGDPNGSGGNTEYARVHTLPSAASTTFTNSKGKITTSFGFSNINKTIYLS